MRIIALVALIGLAACEARIGKEDEAAENVTSAAPVSAEGKAEEGQFSIDAPGFDLKFEIPSGMAERAEVDADSEIVYPGSKLSGMHVEAGAEVQGQENSGVELRFTSPDDPATVAAWYRDPARAGSFTVSSARQEGGAYVLEGVQAREQDPFKVRISPRAGGGSDARLLLSQRG